MTHARAAIPGSTEALVRRVSFRKAGLGPWDPRVEQTWLYTLAAAAAQTGVDVNHTVLVVSHHHTTVTTGDAPVRKFLGRLHHPMSCAMNTLLRRRGFEGFGRFWDGRQPHRMRLLDAAAQMSQLVYQQVQLPAAGLVDRPEAMPGWTFSWDLWRPKRVVRCNRPDVYFDRRYTKAHYDLKFVPPPRLLELFEGDLEKLIYWMKQLEKEALAELRRTRRRRRQRVKGADYVRGIHPWDEPRTPADGGGPGGRGPGHGRVIPTFRLGARGMVGRVLRIRACQEVRAFRAGARESTKAWNAGEHDVVFPYGTDMMRERHGVRVAEPGPDDLVYAPGPSLADIAQRYSRRGPRRLCDGALEVAEQVRAALRDEASLFEDASEARFGVRAAPLRRLARPAEAASAAPANDTVPSPPRPASSRAPTPIPAGVATQRLQGSRTVDPAHPPARIVVHRTHPATGRRATDPPSD